MKESSERKTGAILSYLAIIINTVIQLLYTPLLIRMLGQSEYGLYSLVSSIIGYLTIMDLGFGNAIIVYTSKYRAQKKEKEERKLHGMFNVVFKIIGIVAFILGLILFTNVENIFGSKMTILEIKKMKTMMLILSFNLFITFSLAIYNSIISAYEKFTFQKIVAIIQTILKPLLMIPLLIVGYKSISLCIVITIINLAVVLSNYMYCKKKLRINATFIGFDKVIFKTILGYSIWIFLGIIVDKINWSVDNFVLGAVSGTIAVSIYSIAASINQMFINLSTAISGVLLPKISKMVSIKNTREELTSEMIKVGRIQNYIIFLTCSGFAFFGKYFIVLWAGEGFVDSYYVTLLLIIPASFSLVQNVGLSILQAMNKYKFKTIMNSLMSIFNIVISIILAKKYGAIGAALGTTISLFVGNTLIMNYYYYKIIKLNVVKFWESILKMYLYFSIPCIIIGIIIHYFPLSSFIHFIVYIVLYTIMFLLISYCFVINEYEKTVLNTFLKKIRRIH